MNDGESCYTIASSARCTHSDMLGFFPMDWTKPKRLLCQLFFQFSCCAGFLKDKKSWVTADGWIFQTYMMSGMLLGIIINRTVMLQYFQEYTVGTFLYCGTLGIICYVFFIIIASPTYCGSSRTFWNIGYIYEIWFNNKILFKMMTLWCMYSKKYLFQYLLKLWTTMKWSENYSAIVSYFTFNSLVYITKAR